jgi:hypothetical protein
LATFAGQGDNPEAVRDAKQRIQSGMAAGSGDPLGQILGGVSQAVEQAAAAQVDDAADAVRLNCPPDRQPADMPPPR